VGAEAVHYLGDDGVEAVLNTQQQLAVQPSLGVTGLQASRIVLDKHKEL
jgi:hypothetical protein